MGLLTVAKCYGLIWSANPCRLVHAHWDKALPRTLVRGRRASLPVEDYYFFPFARSRAPWQGLLRVLFFRVTLLYYRVGLISLIHSFNAAKLFHSNFKLFVPKTGCSSKEAKKGIRLRLNWFRPCSNGWNESRLFAFVRSIPTCLYPM